MTIWNGFRALACVIPVIFSLLCGGCASTHETATLEQSLSMLYERVQTLERRVDAADGQANRGADMYARIQELQVKMGALQGRIEELDHKISQLARSTPPPAPPQQSAESSIIIPAPLTSPTPADAHPAATQQQGTAKASPATQVPPPAPREREKENPEKALYDRANQAFQEGRFDAARKDFQALAVKYPKSEFADNALYSAGECYFSEKRYQDAVEAFQQVLDRYPNGNKVPHALLRQGAAFQQLGDSTAARILYERVVEKYPETPQAQAAQKKLKQMK